MTATPAASNFIPPRPRLAVLAVVAVAHVVLLLAWPFLVAPRVATPRLPDARRAPPLVVQLLLAPPAVAPKRREIASRPPDEPRRTAVDRAKAAPAGMRPGVAAAPAVVTTVSPAAPATVAPPAAAAPLNLDLPRAWQRPASAPDMSERALADPRANTRSRPRLESAMAAALSQERSTETLADGTQRIREGNRCTLVHPTRAGGLDPFDRMHNQVGGSEPCP